MTTLRYRNRLRALLTPAEHRVFARLDTPQKIQDFLDRMPVNFEPDGDTAMSPRRVLETGVAHCAEAAVFACAALAYHGKKAWLLDLVGRPSDQDHVVTLFQQRGLWGAISKTNHAILRWRDPIYRSAREVAMTFAHEYALPSGLKSLMSYSRPFSPTRYAPERWVTRKKTSTGCCSRSICRRTCRSRPSTPCASAAARRRSKCARRKWWNGPIRAGSSPTRRPTASRTTSRSGWRSGEDQAATPASYR